MDNEPTILIVDDDPNLRKTLSDIIRLQGYAVLAAAKGKTALNRVKKERPAVALIDLKLPDMDGLEVMEKIKKRSPDTECIVLTGYGSQASAIEAVNLGAYGYLQKPYDVEQLVLTIRRAVEKREAEEALRESEEKYRTVLDDIEEGYFEVDIAGNFTFFNDSLCRIIGYSRDEMMGMNNRQYMDKENAKKVFQAFNRVYTTGNATKGFDWEIIRRDGTRRFIEASVSLTRNAEGEPSGFRGTVRDITERKRAEEAVQHHLERVTALRAIDRAISSTLDLPEVLIVILEQLERIVPHHSAALYLLTDDIAKVTAASGVPDLERVTEVSFPVKDDALAQQLLEEKQPIILADAQADERFQARGGTEYVRSWIGAPLIAREEVIGFLTIDHREPGVYDEESGETALAFASQVAIAIENARLYQAERKRATQLALINKVSKDATSTLEADKMMQKVARSIQKSFNYYNVALYSVDEEHRELVMQGIAGGFEHTASVGYRQPLDEGIIGFVARTGRTWLANDVSQDPYFIKGFPEEVLTKSELCIPVRMGDRVIGVIDLQSIYLDAFDKTDVTTLETLSDQIAMAIENARAYERLKTQNLETISALAAAVEAKDPYTSGHSEKVTQFATTIAEKMGLSDDQVENLRVAGLLHDIGKIGIPDSVLNKPARLTSAERVMINSHSVVSAEIVGKIEALAHLVPIIRHHHEWHDGNGYPDGLKGEEIPLLARILAVADGFEAMTSQRPYRWARSEEEALAELQKGAGTQWDPKVVEVFVKMYEGGIIS